MVLADKGYHTGAELHQCQQDNMITHVAYKEQPSVKHISTGFLSESFLYDTLTDSYTCPVGATLTSLGTWHNKKVKPMKRVTVLKPTAQQTVKPDCRQAGIKQNPHYYKRRQAVFEHPFGTIKRHLGYTHTLLKGLQKVNGEMNLIMFCYNFMRGKSILGFVKMLQTIKHWQPDYSKVVLPLRSALIKTIDNPNGHFFLQLPASVIL